MRLRRTQLLALLLLLMHFIAGVAQAATYTWDFSASGDYTFDSSKIEVTSGQAQLAAPSGWLSSSWTYRRPITIDNTGNASALSNYQVQITLTYYSQMQADFDDVRFTDTDGTTLLDHWQQSKTNSTTATYWVEVPSIGASSTKTIYLYYSNAAAATLSNGEATFELFDDFDPEPITELPHFPLNSYKPGTGTDNRVLAPGTTGEWDDERVLHPSVVNHNGTVYLFYSGFDGTAYQIGVATADAIGFTGSGFTKSGTNPILTDGAGGTWNSLGVLDPYVIYDSDANLWKMWYRGIADDNSSAIGYATSSNPTSGWTQHGSNPVLTTSAAWESTQLLVPSVIKRGANDYLMLYTGNEPASNNGAIGYATSTDGISWTKYAGNPIIAGWNGSAWMQASTFSARSLRYANGVYHILFAAKNAPGGNSYIGYARSTTLLDWRFSLSNPILTPDRAWEGGENENPFAIVIGNNHYIYYDTWFAASPSIGVVIVPSSATGGFDTSKWNQRYGQITQSGSTAVMSGGTWFHSSANWPQSRIIEVVENLLTLSPTTWHTWRFGWRTEGDNEVVNFMWINDSRKWRITQGGSSTENLGTYQPATGSYTYTAFMTDSVAQVTQGGDLSDTISRAASYDTASSNRIFFDAGYDTASNSLERVFIRKYTSPEPSDSTGSSTNPFATDSPTIVPTAAASTALPTGFSETATLNGGTITYQVSSDNGTTWYWYNSGWQTTVGGVSESSSAATINSNIATLPDGDGEIVFKAFLTSDGAQYPQLSDVTLTYDLPSTPTPTPSTSTSTSSSDSVSGAPGLSAAQPQVCGELAPGSAPQLYAASAQSTTSILLQFAPLTSGFTSYALEYGEEPTSFRYGASVLGDMQSRSFVIDHLKPGTTYYFRLRANNGCAPGPWSGTLSVRTRSLGSALLSSLTDNMSPITEVTTFENEPQEAPEPEDTVPSPAPEPLPGARIETFILQLRDADGQPLRNSQVELHSEPKTAITDEDGIARFHDVEPGEHTLKILALNKTAEQKIYLDPDEGVQELRMEVTVRSQSPFREPVVMITLTTMMLGLLALATAVIVLSRKRHA